MSQRLLMQKWRHSEFGKELVQIGHIIREAAMLAKII